MSSEMKIKEIENKYQQAWIEKKVYEAIDNLSSKKKKYVLAEFPYPSGAALHMGHMMRYTPADIYARFLRMQGYNVLFPIGWDAFGLPAENYAIKTGIHPAETTKEAIKNMKKSLISMGFGFDWDREISSIEPEYYKWTQWLFTKFYEHGLAEFKESPVWWCEKLKTVLSEEEVIEDASGNKISERGEHPVVRRNLVQWVLKITDYAEKLLEGLNENEFPESVKSAQRNWIGKSVGAEVDFSVQGSIEKIKIFTTRLDTIFGANFLVVSPEHPLVEKLSTDSYKTQVSEYLKQVESKSEMERTHLNKEKSGVFTGSYAVNPLSHKEIPIYIGDFVLMTYGTGAIMGVPGHDERDFEFAKKMGLEVTQVITPVDNKNENKEIPLPFCDEGVLVDSGDFSGLTSAQAFEKILDFVVQNSLGQKKINYKLRDWVFTRQRYWGEPIPLIHMEDGSIEIERNLPLILPDTPDYNPTEDGSAPLSRNQDWVNVEINGKKGKREVNTMPNWAGSSWYFYRFIDPHNSEAFADFEKLKYWMPVDNYFGGGEHTTVHLLYSRFWNKFFYDLGLVPTSEPFMVRHNNGLLLDNKGKKMSKSVGNVIDQTEYAEKYGADAVKMGLCFLGPITDNYAWNENAIKACHKLLNTIWSLQEKIVDEEILEQKVLLAKLVKNTISMYENLKFNTVVSEIMIFVNGVKIVEKISKTVFLDFIKVLAPMAPFISEEIYQRVSGREGTEFSKENSVHVASFPEIQENLLKEEAINLPIQLNGKLIATILVSPNIDESQALEEAKKNQKVSQKLEGAEIKKIVYVKNRILSIII